MFEAKIFNAINEDEIVGVATIDEDAAEVIELSTEWDPEVIGKAIAENLEEIIDFHKVMMEDPDSTDVEHVEITLPDTSIICVHVDGLEE